MADIATIAAERDECCRPPRSRIRLDDIKTVTVWCMMIALHRGRSGPAPKELGPIAARQWSERSLAAFVPDLPASRRQCYPRALRAPRGPTDGSPPVCLSEVVGSLAAPLPSHAGSPPFGSRFGANKPGSCQIRREGDPGDTDHTFGSAQRAHIRWTSAGFRFGPPAIRDATRRPSADRLKFLIRRRRRGLKPLAAP
jgi:hypothetical protein